MDPILNSTTQTNSTGAVGANNIPPPPAKYDAEYFQWLDQIKSSNMPTTFGQNSNFGTSEVKSFLNLKSSQFKATGKDALPLADANALVSGAIETMKQVDSLQSQLLTLIHAEVSKGVVDFSENPQIQSLIGQIDTLRASIDVKALKKAGNASDSLKAEFDRLNSPSVLGNDFTMINAARDGSLSAQDLSKMQRLNGSSNPKDLSWNIGDIRKSQVAQVESDMKEIASLAMQASKLKPGSEQFNALVAKVRDLQSKVDISPAMTALAEVKDPALKKKIQDMQEVVTGAMQIVEMKSNDSKAFVETGVGKVLSGISGIFARKNRANEGLTGLTKKEEEVANQLKAEISLKMKNLGWA